MPEPDVEFYESLPRSRGAATALLCAPDGRLLLVKPTYKPGWSMPGGVIDEGESPLMACRRECREELGFVAHLERLVCVDWLPPLASPDQRPATVFVFAGVLEATQFDRIRLPAEELSAAILAELAEIDRYLPSAMARRIDHARRAFTAGGSAYLEHGYLAT